MRAALLAKAKAAGPTRSPQQEFDAFLPWWPPQLAFLMRSLRQWLEEYATIYDAEQRHERELAIIGELRRRVASCSMRSRSFLLTFIDRVEAAVRSGMALRRQALAGGFVAADAEEAEFATVEDWLRTQALNPDLMGEAAVLERWLGAWRQARWRTRNVA